MKHISLKEAHELISNAAAIIVNGDALMYASVEELQDDPESEFLYVGWTDGDGYDFAIKATEGENQTVGVEDGDLVLVDHEGETFSLTLLGAKSISVNNGEVEVN